MDIDVRWKWLKGMYIFTIIHAGGTGLVMILMPGFIRNLFGWPNQDPIVFGFLGSVWVAFGLLSILGLRSPLKFTPVLLLPIFPRRCNYDNLSNPGNPGWNNRHQQG